MKIVSNEPLIDSSTAIVDARGPRLRAIRQGHEQLSQLGVAVLRHQPLDIVLPAPSARLTDDRQRRPANVR